jgi:hypothetical protein
MARAGYRTPVGEIIAPRPSVDLVAAKLALELAAAPWLEYLRGYERLATSHACENDTDNRRNSVCWHSASPGDKGISLIRLPDF